MNKKMILGGTVGIIAIGIAFALGLIVGGGSQQPIYEQTPDQARAGTGSAQVYATFETLTSTGNADIRLVEWVRGSDNQEQAALETGVCSLDRIERDECLPNPFFVRKTEKRLSLSITPSARIRVLSPGPSGEVEFDQDQNMILRDIDLAAFSEMLNQNLFSDTTPFIITTTNGMITEIQEQYIP